MSGYGEVPPGVDPTVPSVARMYDYYLGGKDNYESDRIAAEKVIELGRQAGADVKGTALSNRAFLVRAVRTLAEAGIRQFLDIGTGLPTQENVHEVALRHAPDSRIVYVDNDPTVLAHARALLADDRQTTVVQGDLTDPESILGDAVLQERIDFGEPVAVIFCAILHFIPDDEAAANAVARFRQEMCSGSHLVLSHLFPGQVAEEMVTEFGRIYHRTATGSITVRSLKQIREFFTGTELLPPGLVPVEAWRHGDGLREDYVPDYRTPSCLGGIGRVP
ncbi:SAM-dependent methyltransferase [Thermomonospora curvata]|uniref:SAM-dependent methyltransferase n=1 Tax=Thermomonospora curvata (strain ATCC 19995 / DSM 43183 / JCM 3096 / KCTC 9072 / NBRC 15933 / NCIMB 10081 / Henssen B9) TaxID=471852 RepID=D1ACY9_THECD|nr:SAM-dependent methyltransferase [Thermomonospora curvata]ACY99298.1 protein of unknown function DUF574 [Thermomonospora curvata DSM 43183]